MPRPYDGPRGPRDEDGYVPGEGELRARERLPRCANCERAARTTYPLPNGLEVRSCGRAECEYQIQRGYDFEKERGDA